MDTSVQSIEDFTGRLQNGLNSLNTMEGTIDQAYIKFRSSEQEAAAAVGKGVKEGSDDAETSPEQVLHALERLFRSLVEVGFLSRIRETRESVQPRNDAAQAPVLYDDLVRTKENIQGQVREADMQSESTHKCYQRMKQQISEQRKRATQLLSDAQSLLEMQAQAEQLEAQAQQLRISFEDTSRSLGLVQQQKVVLEVQNQQLQDELRRQPFEQLYISDTI